MIKDTYRVSLLSDLHLTRKTGRVMRAIEKPYEDIKKEENIYEIQKYRILKRCNGRSDRCRCSRCAF